MLTGSHYFFSQYEDFQGNDIDYITIEETDQWKDIAVLSGRGMDIFRHKKQSDVDTYIKLAVTRGPALRIASFLTPEFAAAIGLQIEDLPKLALLLDELYPKYLYYRIIYEAYIENNKFELTPEQRLAAYKSYKETRGIDT